METDRQTVETGCPQPPTAMLSTSGTPMPAYVVFYGLWTFGGKGGAEREKDNPLFLPGEMRYEESSLQTQTEMEKGSA